jgi:hypothetical protein
MQHRMMFWYQTIDDAWSYGYAIFDYDASSVVLVLLGQLSEGHFYFFVFETLICHHVVAV